MMRMRIFWLKTRMRVWWWNHVKRHWLAWRYPGIELD